MRKEQDLLVQEDVLLVIFFIEGDTNSQMVAVV